MISGTAHAQGSHRDSLFYKKIKKFATRHKLTKRAYELVFRDPEPVEYPKPASKKEGQIVNPYLKYKDQVIKSIRIVVEDPFGYTIKDTLPHDLSPLDRFGNGLHIKTRKWVIRNRLLFKRNAKVDPIAMSESERLLRLVDFVNDARVYINPIPDNDSVNVTVIVLDKWPLTGSAAATLNSTSGNFTNRDLFGWGQHFEQSASYARNSRNYQLTSLYNISNIGRTFISSSLRYHTVNTETDASVSFDRPFFSPLAKWAGGLSVSQTWDTYMYNDTTDKVTKPLKLDHLDYDVWLGKTFKLSNRKTLFNESTNLVTSLRYYATQYQDRPSFKIDTNLFYTNTNVILGNVGFAVQQYYKDQYIYRFGANEDVPEGLIVQGTYGVMLRELDRPRFYLGAEIARAIHFKRFGYITATFAYGILYNIDAPNNITITGETDYFSNLVKGGRWYFRQFANIKYIDGINKPVYQTIQLHPEEMYGFSAATLMGNSKTVLNLQTVAYSPLQLIGFKFAPVVMMGYGTIDNEASWMRNKIYQAYAFGLMIRNENLITSTFQVTFGLYPSMANGKIGFTLNPITSFTLKVRGFAMGKPSMVTYY